MHAQGKTWRPISTGHLFIYFLKWLGLSLVVGGLAGSASAFFLWSLDVVTVFREVHLWLVWLLPLGGLLIGLTYHYWGEDVVKGNNQLLEEFYSPKKVIPLRMAPLVLWGTLATHLFGGSAGREGTAVQMGGAIADQFTRIFKLRPRDRRIFLPGPLLGAVFAGATNTPLACVFMGIELFGVESGVFIALAVVMAYLFSGHTGIYGSQVISSPKHILLGRERGRALHDL